jgi:hypothetical protein
MTSNGDVKLDYDIYKLSVLNFLLGKRPNGPGQFIFVNLAPESGHNLFTEQNQKRTKKEINKEVNKEVDKIAEKETFILRMSYI